MNPPRRSSGRRTWTTADVARARARLLASVSRDRRRTEPVNKAIVLGGAWTLGDAAAATHPPSGPAAVARRLNRQARADADATSPRADDPAAARVAALRAEQRRLLDGLAECERGIAEARAGGSPRSTFTRVVSCERARRPLAERLEQVQGQLGALTGLADVGRAPVADGTPRYQDARSAELALADLRKARTRLRAETAVLEHLEGVGASGRDGLAKAHRATDAAAGVTRRRVAQARDAVDDAVARLQAMGLAVVR